MNGRRSLINQYIEHLVGLNYSPTTIRTRKYILEQLVSSGLSIEEFLARGISPSTRNRELQVISLYYDWARETGHAKANPVKRLSKSKMEARLPKIVSSREINDIVDSIDTSTFAGVRDKAIIEVGLSIASRISDFRTMTISGLDLERKTIIVFGKGRRECIQPLGKMAVAALKQYLPVREAILAQSKSTTDALFINENGSPVKSFYYILKRYLRDITPHQFMRHSIAIASLRNGMKLEEVRDLLRHQSIATTAHYLRFNSDLQDAHSTYHPRG